MPRASSALRSFFTDSQTVSFGGEVFEVEVEVELFGDGDEGDDDVDVDADDCGESDSEDEGGYSVVDSELIFFGAGCKSTLRVFGSVDGRMGVGASVEALVPDRPVIELEGSLDEYRRFRVRSRIGEGDSGCRKAAEWPRLEESAEYGL